MTNGAFSLTPMAVWHGQRWGAFRRILDRVTSNPHYNYDDPAKHGYLKAARFCSEMMGIHNTLAWKYSDEGR